VKFSKEKDLFEEGCLSFPKMYADVEVRIERRRRARLSRHARDERADDDQNINIR
jgi:peptide deformylase